MIDYISYTHAYHPDVLVVEVSGKLDSITSQYLLDCIEGFIGDEAEKIVLDCGDVDQINSMGLAVLVRANSRLKKIGGTMAIASAAGTVAEILHIVHFDRLFGLYPNVDEAAAAITKDWSHLVTSFD
ncbi:putative anti-sigma factor antagonist [Rubripirellula obstinata]|uniref:Anti-sigma factor antagonist n=1 Tax=Rubripirellula obstinata TaxID=406547 RepID=A0A5B1CP46_9BACT|nr:STAS domain-containing protein [Rubripirellula obstinata]KAA1262021.1 putative anti-sigma factor antagonist [Rubripirellula obstinata]